MALTADVKDELARIEITKSSVRVAELSTILRFAGAPECAKLIAHVAPHVFQSRLSRARSRRYARLGRAARADGLIAQWPHRISADIPSGHLWCGAKFVQTVDAGHFDKPVQSADAPCP